MAQVFLEEAHFSHREDFLSLPQSTVLDPGALDLGFQAGLTQDRRRAVLRVRATTEGATTSPLYQVTVVMTALVEIDEQAPNMSLEQYISAAGFPLLVPFIRQAVADLTGRGRFGPIWLQPVNVRASLDAPPSPPAVAEPAAPYRAKRRLPRSGRKGNEG